MMIKGQLKEHVAAVSIGLKDGCPILDLDYDEDSSADTDLNVVMTRVGDHRNSRNS